MRGDQGKGRGGAGPQTNGWVTGGLPRERWRERRCGEARQSGLWFECLERSDLWWPPWALQPQLAQSLRWGQGFRGGQLFSVMTSTESRGPTRDCGEGSQEGGPSSEPPRSCFKPCGWTAFPGWVSHSVAPRRLICKERIFKPLKVKGPKEGLLKSVPPDPSAYS